MRIEIDWDCILFQPTFHGLGSNVTNTRFRIKRMRFGGRQSERLNRKYNKKPKSGPLPMVRVRRPTNKMKIKKSAFGPQWIPFSAGGGGGVGRKKIDPSSERRLMIVHRGLIMAIMAPSCPVPTCPNNPNRIATSTAFQSPLGQTERHRETKKKKKIKKTRVVKGKKTSQQSLNGVDRKIFLFF